MESRVDYVMRYHSWGYNCAQAVAMAYIDLVGADATQCFKGMEAFGGGMGCKKGSCGALSGAMYLIGLKESGGDITNNKDAKTKMKSYALATSFFEAFEKMQKVTICQEIKEEIKDKKTCRTLIEETALLVEEIIFPEFFKKEEEIDY